MKRILLITILFFSFFSLYSQSFKVNYTLRVSPGNSTYGGGCDNKIIVKIFYRVNGGSEQSKEIFRQDLNGGGGTYNLSQTISGGDVYFTKVETITSREWRRFIGGCGGNGSFHNSLRTTSINSRCTKFLSGTGLARWWVTSLNVDIKPVVNLTPKNVTACQSGSAVVNSGFHSSSAYSGIYRWEFLDPVNTVSTITSGYQALITARDNAYQIWQDCENFNGGGGGPIFEAPPSANEDNEKENLQTSSGRNPILVPGPGGNPSSGCRMWYDRYVTAWNAVRDYTGERYYPRKIWRAIPSENGRAIADITLADLYSREADRLEAMTNKVISIRINPNCSGEGDINTPTSISQIQFLSDPPPITGTDFSSPTCSYDPIDNFKIFFSRQLLSTERLNINLKRKLTQAPFTYQTIGNNINISSFTEISPGNFRYTWNPSGGNELPEAGEYRIELSGASGNPFCNNGKLTYDFTIAIPPKVNFPSATKVKDVTCFNGADGAVKITASGGNGPYRYKINGSLNNTTFTSERTVSGLSPGTYKFTVIDSNGCEARDGNNRVIERQVTINNKTKITHSVTSSSSEIINPGKPGGTDGSIRINSVSGGTLTGSLYKYTILLNGTSSSTLSGNANKNGFTIVNLPKGTHKIRYEDSSGCISEDYVLPTLTDPLPVEFKYSITAIKCNGGTGKIKVYDLKGGYSDYKIKIEATGQSTQEENSVGTGEQREFTVSAGNFKITVTDSRDGSAIKDHAAAEFNDLKIGEPNKIVITNVNATPISCYNGKSTVTLTASGGQPGVVYEYAIQAANLVWQSSNVFSLGASPNIGYRFVARDKNLTSCKSEPTNAQKISQPTELSYTITSQIPNNINGDDKGEISISPNGGTSGYTVTWRQVGVPGFSDSGIKITGLKEGKYIGTIEDTKGCTLETDEIELIDPDKLEVSISIDQEISCYGGNGILKANPAGGSENYTYKWYRNNVLISGANSISYTGVQGNYKVEIKDGYTSVTSDPKTLGEPSIITLGLSKVDITCNTEDDGKIILSVNGGTPPYYYSIDDKTTYLPVNNLLNKTITDLTDGIFEVWIKDGNDCEILAAQSIEIIRPTTLEISSFNIVNNQIINDSKGEIQIQVSGGTSPYTYEWTDNFNPVFSESSKDISNLPASTYKVVVTDKNNCKVSQEFDVKEPLPLSVNVTQTKEVLCFEEQTGELLAEVTGGYPLNSVPSDFDYKWYEVNGTNTVLLNSSNLKLDKISNLKAGNYRVVINDSKGATTSKDFEIIQPSRIVTNIDSKQNVSCFEGNDGLIELSVSGGTPPYTYKWTSTTNTSFTSTTKNISNLKKGEYKVVISDSNGCNQPELIIEINEPSEELSVSNETVVNLTGFETDNGSISVDILGGTPSYTYEWRVKGNTTIIGNTNELSPIAAGNYELTVTDSNSCVLTKEYVLTQPDLLVVDTITQTNDVLCYGDKGVELEVSNISGGVSPYSYEWILKGDSTVLNTGTKLSNVGAGTYVIMITDDNGNEASKEYTVVEPAVLAISNVDSHDVSCFEGNDGFIDLTITGGVLPYTYSWKHGETTSRIENLKKGTYEVTIRDKNLCEVSRSFTITEPSEVLSISNETVVNLTGFETDNGSISVDISGGTPSYTYEWRVKGNTSIIGNTNTLSSIAAGAYELTVIDSNSCSLVEDYTVTQPALLEVDIQETLSILCNGDKGILTATVTGGVTPYSYEWTLKGDTTVIGTTNKLENTSAGTYVIKITDDNGNEASKEYTVVEPAVLAISNVDSQDVSCFEGNDGFIDLTITGGVLPYTYSWKHGETTSRIENLKKGTYEVTIRDKNLCEVSRSFTITEPSEGLSISNETVVNLTGFETDNGSISVDISGGTPSYTYEWRVKGNTSIIGSTNTLSSIAAGAYELTVIDSNSCSLVEDYTVTQPALLEVDIQETLSILCNGDKGILTATVTGGVTPYSYDWTLKGNTTVLGTTNKLENTSAGTYVIKITDDNGNEASKEYTVVEPAVLAISNVDLQDVSCFEGNDGFIDLTISGGVLPYTYSWKHGETTSRIENLKKGTYEVTIRDKNLCEVSRSFTITEPSEGLSISNETVVNLTGFETDNGSISVDISGGTPSYTYEWRVKGNTSIIGSTNTLSSIAAGAYELTVIDSNSCSLVEDYTVTQPALLEVDIQETLSILCNGDKGILTATVTGGVTPYSYEWTLKGNTTVLGTTNKLENTSAGTYVIKITDDNGNEASKEYTVVEPAVLAISNVDSQDVSCFEGNDGFIDLTISGGVLPYTYSWKHGETTSRIENLKKGTYEVTIRDKNLCEVSRSFTITEPSEGLSISNETVVNLTGFETDNGSISVDISGGTPSYTYEWRVKGNVAIIGSTNTLSSIAAGAYELTVIDSNSCSLVEDYTVTQPALLEVDIQESLSILCNGDKGILTANVTGGVTPYSYEWTLKGNTTVLGTTNKLENTSAGTYVIKITDDNNNETSKEYTLTEPTLFEVSNISTNDVTCYNGTDGLIDVSVTGGVPPYTYSWNHTTDIINRLENISAGTYSLTISDKNGCEINRDIEIKQPVEYDIISVKLNRPASDIVNDGTIEVEITGGNAPYNYVWTDDSGNIISNQTTSLVVNKIENLGEGTYNIVVTDASNCIINETYNLANPGEILVSVTQVQEIKCYNSSNAILDVITVGGVGGNTYKWFDASNDQQIGNEKQLKDIPAGQYYVIVSNAEGIQEKSSVFVVSQPEEMKVTISTIDPSCFEFNNGSFELTVQGGIGNYEYRYRKSSGYSNWTSISGNKATVNNLNKGEYKLQVRDANSCLALDSSSSNEFIISIDEPLALELSKEEVVNLSGFELSNGSISIEVTGGTPGYTYQWLDGSGNNIATGVTAINNLEAGNYSVIIEDTNGCRLEKNYVVTQPDKLEVSVSRTSIISCNGEKDGSLEASVSGGVSGYTYQWFIEGNSSVIGTSSNLTNLGPGNYYVIIEDVNSNTVTSSIFMLVEPAVLDLSLSSDYVSCGTGTDWTITTNVTGGTAPYVYLWNTGDNGAELTNVVAGVYEVTVLDANGCRTQKSITLNAPATLELSKEEIVNLSGFELSNGSISIEVTGGTPGYTYQWLDGSGNNIATGVTTINNLEAGNYSVILEDIKGCRLEKNYVITQPDKLEVSVSSTSIISCNGENDGTLEASVSGGVSGYTYQWFREGNSAVIGTSSSLTNLGPGNYYVIIEDANSNAVTSLTFTLVEPAILDLSLSSDYVLCGTGTDWTITTNVTGGTAPYVYLWNTGDNSADLTNVVAGVYEVTVLDANGCRTQKSITLNAPATLELSKEEVVNLSGFELSNGSISIEVTGGTPGYTYQWLDGSGNNIATGVTTINNLEAGNYSVIIEDIKGCRLEKNYVITQPEKLEVSVSSTSIISCNGENDGTLEASVSGGVSGYTYQWFREGNSAVIGTSSSLTNLGPGNYYVIIEDANSNAVTSSTFTLVEPAILDLSLSSDYVLCGTGTDWTITTNVTGGTAPYVYLWNTGDNSADLTNVVAGVYEVTVLDANGCRTQKSITLNAPATLELSKEEVVNLSGFELSNGSISIEVTGGTPGYTYQWLDGSGNNIATGVTAINNLKAGNYSVIIEDTKGCRLEKNYVVTQPDKLEVSVSKTSIISCNGENDGSLEASVSGGVSGYTYQWFREGNSAVIGTSSNLTNLGPGNYYVIIEDVNSNTVTSSIFTLVEPAVLDISLSSDYVLCGTGTDWTITTNVTGGTAPYVYLWNTGDNSADLTNVVAGVYEVTVLDANGCKTNRSITLTPPNSLVIESDVITNPTCFEGNDGSISVNVIGGTPPYSYNWTNGDTSNISQGLSEGSYEVVVTDSKGCEISKAYVVENPEQIALDLGEDVTLCKGQTYIIDGRIENGVDYTWTSSNGFTSTDSVIEVTEEGTYKVLAIDSNGCQIEDEIEIFRSTEDISANFIVSSQVYIDEVFVAVNVSDPVPDEVDWILPPEAVIKEVNNSFAELSFAEEGEYEITLYTKKGECEAFLTKKILVLERDFDDPTDGNGSTDNNTPMIQGMVVFPNPSSGVFTLDVELKEASSISVKIFSLLSNDLIDYRKMDNESEYKIDYNLNLMSGLYFVVLESKGERIVKKIIIQ